MDVNPDPNANPQDTHGSADPDPETPQNVMDPQHWVQPWGVKRDTQTTWIHRTKICTTSSTYSKSL